MDSSGGAVDSSGGGAWSVLGGTASEAEPSPDCGTVGVVISSAKAQGIIPKHSTNTSRSDTMLRKCFIVFSPSLKMGLLPPQRRREPVVMQRTGRTAEERG